MFSFPKKKEEVIYDQETTCKMWLKGMGSFHSPIRTIVIKKTGWFGMKFEIKQFYKKISRPTFDGEYSSNELMDQYVSNERTSAEMAIINYKCNNNV